MPLRSLSSTKNTSSLERPRAEAELLSEVRQGWEERADSVQVVVHPDWSQERDHPHDLGLEQLLEGGSICYAQGTNLCSADSGGAGFLKEVGQPEAASCPASPGPGCSSRCCSGC